MHRSSRTAVAVVIAALALMLAGGAGATAAFMITGKQIKDGTVTSKDVENRSLRVKDFRPATRKKLTGPRGVAGPAGANGATGATGLPGLPGVPGLAGFEVVTSSVNIPALGSGSVPGACPAGKKAISATAGYAAPLTGLSSQVTRVSDTAFQASGLSTTGAGVLTLDVVCATVAP